MKKTSAFPCLPMEDATDKLVRQDVAATTTLHMGYGMNAGRFAKNRCFTFPLPVSYPLVSLTLRPCTSKLYRSDFAAKTACVRLRLAISVHSCTYVWVSGFRSRFTNTNPDLKR